MLNLASLNQRVNALTAKINNIVPGGTQDLATTLLNGNSAGANDLDMNSNDITNVSLINGSAYPPAPPATPALSAVLTAGDNAGGLSITNLNDLGVTTINGSAYPPAETLNQVLLNGNTASGSHATITLTDTDAGGQANPILTLNNTNATGSVAMEVYKNKPTAGVAGDVLFNQSVYGKDSGNTKQEYTRISHTLRDATGGGEDGSIEFSAFVNGAVATFLQINGNENEINILKPLDMGGNQIRTTSGNIDIDATLSGGAGSISLTPKLNGSINLNAGTGAGNVGTINATTQNGNINLNTTGSGDVVIYAEDTTTITGKAGLNLETVVATADISIKAGFTGTGDITLNSGILILDSDDLRLTNSATVAVVQNHTSSLGTTSNIADITNYLKVKLNGADVWLPYFTTNPSV